MAPHPIRQTFQGYAHGGDVRPVPYALLAGLYAAALGGFGSWFRRSGRQLPATFGAGDVALLGVATFKLSRLIARDKVTSFLRAPFTVYKGNAPGPEVQEQPREGPVRRSVGELISCPFCVSQWVGTGFTCVYVASPRLARTAAAGLAAVTISDGLQYAETALQQVES